MREYVCIGAKEMRKLHTFAFPMDTLQAGGRRFDSGTLHYFNKSPQCHLRRRGLRFVDMLVPKFVPTLAIYFASHSLLGSFTTARIVFSSGCA